MAMMLFHVDKDPCSVPIYCKLGRIQVDQDLCSRLYLFSLEQYGVIYTCTVEQVRRGEQEWMPGLERAVDLLRTFS